MKIMGLARGNSNRGLLVLFMIGFVHNVGATCAVANLPNIFSWLLWLSIGLYLVWSAWRSIGSMLTTYLSHNINFRLFK